jgi:hypothetical protein
MQGYKTTPDGRSSSLKQVKYMLHLGVVVFTISDSSITFCQA